jgi:hypothetical protein
MKILKSAVLIFFALMIVFTSSCGRNLKPLTDFDQMCEEVLTYLDTDDVEGLKSMFCEKTIKETPDLDEQIEAAMEFYEGKTVSHGNILGVESDSVDNGVTTEHYIGPHITRIETDSGDKYDIVICSYLIYSKDTTKEGITEIDIYNEDKMKCTIGKYMD